MVHAYYQHRAVRREGDRFHTFIVRLQSNQLLPRLAVFD